MQERLQKYLARAGIASRRAAETLITAGRVKVNGSIVRELGTKVDGAKDLVVVDGKPAVAPSEKTWFLLYKPPGVVTTLKDPQGRPTISDYLHGVPSRVFPVGRLDYDAEGALLLTDDGDVANKLMHPRHQVRRVYLAKVKGDPTDASLEKLRGGVRLEDGFAKPTDVSRFEKADKNTWLRLVVTEGRPHLIKRLCAAIGHPVVRLFRPSHAGIPVDGLKPGHLRELTTEEVKRIHQISEGKGGADPALKLPPRRHGHGIGKDEPEEEAPEPPRRSEGGPRQRADRRERETPTRS
ncbi:MAG: rRNA pseudouridine synthase [Archangiaceae bacterium]|nr:rRNA pseudouridine synthase [Archangiaceae bacterium]